MFDTAESFKAKIANAQAAYRGNRTRSLSWRKQQLRQLSSLIFDNEEQIRAALKADLNKSKNEALLHELNVVKAEVFETIKHLDEWAKPTSKPASLMGKTSKLYTVPEPFGTTLIIGTWNYPITLVCNPLVGAIAGGNTAVCKFSEMTPNVSKCMAELFPKYMDSEAFPVVITDGPGSAELLKQRFDFIFFTGGPAIGKMVMKAAAEYLTPVILELGGKNPVWVDPTADLNRTARSLMWSKTTNTGQICLCPDYVLVPDSIKPALIAEMKKVLNQFHGSDPAQSDDYDGKIVNQRHTARLIKLMTSSSGQIVIGGEHDEQKCYIAPTVIDNVKPSDPIMQEEIFGPLLPLISCNDFDSAVNFINEREKPLSAYCFTGSQKISDKFIAQTSSGGVCINDVMMHFTEPSLPFGGIGQSGMGAYHGKLTFDAFVHHKAVYEQKTPMLLLSMREAPISDGKISLLGALLDPSLEPRLINLVKLVVLFGLAYVANEHVEMSDVSVLLDAVRQKLNL